MQIKAPKITTFRFPVSQATVSSGIVFIFIVYCTFSPKDGTSSLFLPARLIQAYVGENVFRIVWGLVVVLHSLEGIYTYSLCHRHSAGFLTSVSPFLLTIQRAIHTVYLLYI